MKLRRWLPILLTLCLLFSLTATAAYAADGDDDITIAETIDIVDEPMAGDGTYALWVGSTQVTDANASNLCGGKASYDAATNTLTFTAKPTISGTHEGAMIYAATDTPLTINMPSASFSLSTNGEVGIYTEKGLVVNGTLDLDLYGNEDSYGVKSMNGPVTINGEAIIFVTETGIYCGKGDVTITGSAYFAADSEATEGFCPSSLIYTADGGVDVKTFGLEFGVAAYGIYANGPVHVREDLNFDNTQAGMAGGSGIKSTAGGVVCDGNVTIVAGNGATCIGAGNAAEGITIKGDANLTNKFSSENSAAISAFGGPIKVEGDLTVDGYGEYVVDAKGDIIVGGNADIKANCYNTSTRRDNAMRSSDGSISITGSLKASSVGLGVYAYKDVTVNGDATLTGCVTAPQAYILKAETGAVSVGGKLTTTGMADWVVYGGTGITVNGEVSIVSKASLTVTNPVEESNGMYSGGNICFIGGNADIDVYQTALSAKDGFVFLPGYGVTLPAGGRATVIDGAYTVTEADAVTVAAHVIISDKVSLEDGYYLIGPDWTAFDIDPAQVFAVNPENSNEYMLTTTLGVGDEIKVVHVENGAITAWYPEGEGTEYTVDEAHAGSKTIYFKTTYSSDWSAFGGYFYIEANPVVTGYRIIVDDYTKGAATTSLDAEALYSGEVSFTVACDKVCKVGVLNADGTITKLSCTTEDEVHSFTVTVTDADVNLVIVVKGDVNLDGNLKGSDSTFIKKLMVELVELDEEKAAIQSFAGDVNDDGKLKQNDATMISRIMVELETLTW